MFPLLLFLFIAVPLIEVMILIRLGDALGFSMALLLVIGTGILGAFLARLEGWRAWNEVRRAMDTGRMPTREIVEAVLILLAGVVLITPGILTDILGLLILIPITRKWFIKWLQKKIEGRVNQSQTRREDFEYRIKGDDE